MMFTRKASVTAEQPAAGVVSRDLVPVDAPQPAQLRRGRIRGSIHIPAHRLRDRLLELDRDQHVAFLCDSEGRSSRATGIAIKAGHDAVNAPDGMIAWNHAGLLVNR
jgi:hydroxyacylglutathione hydrolase